MAILMLFAARANACSCREVPFAEAVGTSGLVALVHVEAADEVMYTRDSIEWCAVRHEVFVTQSFKGSAPTRIILESSICDESSCGKRLVAGNTYLVYTSEATWPAQYPLPNALPRYAISLCSRILTLEMAGGEIDSLTSGNCNVAVTNDGWTISCTDGKDLCFGAASNAMVFDVQGRHIAATSTLNGARVFISNVGMPTTSLWARVGECLVRLR